VYFPIVLPRFHLNAVKGELNELGGYEEAILALHDRVTEIFGIYNFEISKDQFCNIMQAHHKCKVVGLSACKWGNIASPIIIDPNLKFRTQTYHFSRAIDLDINKLDKIIGKLNSLIN
jgi:hypothetical protein